MGELVGRIHSCNAADFIHNSH